MSHELRQFWNEKTSHSEEMHYAIIEFLASFSHRIPNRKILEIGCGTGLFSSKMSELSPEKIVGVDFSEKAIQLANDQYQNIDCLEFLHADLLDCELDETYDLIVGTAILHEIDINNTDKLLVFLNRHLKKDGVGYFLENSFFNPVFRFVRKHIIGRYGTYKMGSEHETPFDPERYKMYLDNFLYCERSAKQFVMLERFFGQFARKHKKLFRFGQETDQVITKLFGDSSLTRSWSYHQEIYFSNSLSYANFMNINIV